MVREVSSEEFKNVVLENENPVIVDFWAPWCMPCRMMAPIFEKVANDFADKDVEFVKVNVDEASDIAALYGIQGIPTILGFVNGDVVASHTGVMSEPMLKEFVEKVLEETKR